MRRRRQAANTPILQTATATIQTTAAPDIDEMRDIVQPRIPNRAISADKTRSTVPDFADMYRQL